MTGLERGVNPETTQENSGSYTGGSKEYAKTSGYELRKGKDSSHRVKPKIWNLGYGNQSKH